MKHDEQLKCLVNLAYDYDLTYKRCVNCGAVCYIREGSPVHEEGCVVGEVETYLQHLKDFERNWQRLQAEEMKGAD